MKASELRTIPLSSGESIPALGLGTWHMGEELWRREDEVDAIRTAIDLGMTLIDTAEMYGDGRTEELVGQAIAGRRDEIFLVSKVLPSNATLSGTRLACERSLRRLKTDRIDLYLLHWRGRVPLEETIDAFGALIAAGKIRSWGVSNFDTADMTELVQLPGGSEVQTNQVLFNLTRRGVEWELLSWCRSRKIPLMAYSPIEQGSLLDDATLHRVAKRHGATPAQVALAWVLRHDGVSAIPKAGRAEHARENREALALRLTKQDLEALDQAFPPPKGPQPLEML